MALLILTKDWDSFEYCLRKNDVIPDKNESDSLKKCLQDRPYSKFILKCCNLLYFLLIFVDQLVNICYSASCIAR